MPNQVSDAPDQSFLPVYDRSARVLILGSLPGKRSIAEQGYYAHPQNAFWPIMAQLVGFRSELDYAARLTRLKQAGVALWDVVAEAQRPGSLDSAIVRSGAQYNEIPKLLTDCSGIELIAFNGGAAQELFLRAQKTWQADLSAIKLVKLPSTSPAHAVLNRQQKYEAWSAALSELLTS